MSSQAYRAYREVFILHCGAALHSFPLSPYPQVITHVPEILGRRLLLVCPGISSPDVVRMGGSAAKSEGSQAEKAPTQDCATIGTFKRIVQPFTKVFTYSVKHGVIDRLPKATLRIGI